MSDQATKLRAIIDQKMQVNCESKESNELEREEVSVSEIMGGTNTVRVESQLELEEQVDDINYDEGEKDFLSKQAIMDSMTGLEQTQKRLLEKQREIGMLAIASNHSPSVNASFILNVGIQLQNLGKRVCIIDGDGSLFDHFNRDNHEVNTLTDVINQRVSLSEVIMNGPQQVKILKSGDFIFTNPLTEEMLPTQLELLSEIDFVLFNTGTDLSRAAMISLILAQELIVLSMSDISAIKNTYSFLKTIDRYQIKSIVRVLLEQSPNGYECQKGLKLLTELTDQFLKLKISNLGSINSNMFLLSNSEQSQSREEMAIFNDKLRQLPLLGKKCTTMQQIINKLIQLCS